MLMVEGDKSCEQQKLLCTIYRQSWNPLKSNINGLKHKKNTNKSSGQAADGEQQASAAASATTRESGHHDNKELAVDVSVFNKNIDRHRFINGIRRKIRKNTIELNHQRHHAVASERDKTIVELRKSLNLATPPPIITYPQQRHHAAGVRSSLATLCLEGSTPPVQRSKSRSSTGPLTSTKRPVVAPSTDVVPAPFLISHEKMLALQIYGQSLAKRGKCCVCKADDCDCMKLANVQKDDDNVSISDDDSVYTDDDEEEESDLSDDTESEWEDVERMRKLYADANKSTTPLEDFDSDNDFDANEDGRDYTPKPYQFADALAEDYDRYVKEFPVRIRRGSTRRIRELQFPSNEDQHQEAVVGRLLKLKKLQYHTKQEEAIQRQRHMVNRVQSARRAEQHAATPTQRRPSTQGCPVSNQRLHERRIEWAQHAAQAGNLVEKALRNNDLTIIDRNWTMARGRHVRRRIEARFQSLRQSAYDVDERRMLRHKEKRRIRIALSKLYNYSWSERCTTMTTSARPSLTHGTCEITRTRSARSARSKKSSPVKGKSVTELPPPPPPPPKYPHEASKSSATRKLSSAPGGRRRKGGGHKRTKNRRKASLC